MTKTDVSAEDSYTPEAFFGINTPKITIKEKEDNSVDGIHTLPEETEKKEINQEQKQRKQVDEMEQKEKKKKRKKKRQP